MAADLVFITGANGHVGYAILVAALRAGYSVRAAVRSQDKADKIRAGPSVESINPGTRLSFVIVPDMLAPGAYNTALEGAKYAIHVASPITSGLKPEQYQSGLIDPAVKGTINFLEAAAKTSTLQRVVITSSIAALTYSTSTAETSDKIFNERSRVGNKDVAGPHPTEFAAYSASKALALNLAEAFMDERRPEFSLVHIHPSFVIGPDEMTTNPDDVVLRGTNRLVIRGVLGLDMPPLLDRTCHVDDVARVHVRALDNDIPSGASLVVSTETRWADAIEVVNGEFPAAVKSGVLPNDRAPESRKMVFDTTWSEKTVGWKYRSFKEQVVDLVGWYLKLKGWKEK